MFASKSQFRPSSFLRNGVILRARRSISALWIPVKRDDGPCGLEARLTISLKSRGTRLAHRRRLISNLLAQFNGQKCVANSQIPSFRKFASVSRNLFSIRYLTIQKKFPAPSLVNPAEVQ